MKDRSIDTYMRIGIIGVIIGLFFQPPVFCGWIIVNAILLVATAVIFKYFVDPFLWLFISMPITIIIAYISMMWIIKNPEMFFGSKDTKKLKEFSKK
jgi:hypothetical protein